MERVTSKTRWAICLTLVAFSATAIAAVARAQQTVDAKRFVVTSGHPDATAAGLAVLRNGGNVVDAAVTTSLCLGVAEPYASGIGGKAMLLYRDGKTGKVSAIEAMCAASKSLDATQFATRSQRERLTGYYSVGVPGLVAALAEAHERWGSKKWHDLASPAAHLATNGVTVSEKMYGMMRPKRNLLRRDPEAARLYLADGETPAVGSVMKNADLAHTMQLIADRGPQAFYEGEIADQIVAAANDAGAPLTKDDFRSYKPRSSEPLAIDFDGYRIYSCPPPLTGGTTVLTALRAIEGVAALDTTNGRDPKYMDLVGRALLAIYPRVGKSVADVSSASGDAKSLLADKSVHKIQEEAAALDPAAAEVESVETSMLLKSPDDFAEASTTHFIVADKDGNIVCLTQSLSYHFGACVVAPGTGIMLNDSMSNFSTSDPEGCNFVAPGKRERSTIAPIIATKNDKPVLALGIPGSQRIPTTTIQLLTDILHFGKPLQEAFDRPRFHIRRPLSAAESGNVVDLEDDAPAAFDAELTALRWYPERHTRDGSYFGGGSAVQYLPGGRLQGVADLRRTNFADGE
jgi:gamma-glutamyltranspeptidase / glutathione hydrolase